MGSATNTALLDEDADRAVERRHAAAAARRPTRPHRGAPDLTLIPEPGDPYMPPHTPSSVDSITEQTFAERVLQAERPVLIQFWATWCHPCRMVTPIVEQLAAERSGTLDVVKIDLDEEPELADRHGITAVPAFVVYAGGRPVGSWVGAAPMHVLEQKLADIGGTFEHGRVTGVQGSGDGR
ncbi:thioredoxin family protein [Nonomuraea sp. NPDC000554]|uniref:thioredoxin family protein n=1 Tax=Nonomuraea sp. NPDC000554 TaxID=3154259 RepID=UPI00331EEE6C